MNSRKKRIFSLVAFLLITVVIFAQQVGSNSPYSRYGYGLLSNPSLGASEAMGGISYGLRRSQQVNPGNPASYSELDSLTFIFDMGVSGHLAHMNDGSNKRDYYNGNFDYVAMQFPLLRNVGGSIGLLPYSKTGYNFGGVRSLSNMQYLESYRGTGGLTQIYVGAAWEPVKNFSAGVNVSYLFGSFSRSSVVIPVSSGALVTEDKHSYSIRDLKYDFGWQYQHQFDKNRSVTIGAVYTPSIHPKADLKHSVLLFSGDPYENPWLNPTQEKLNDTIQGASFQLPETFGLGFTYTTGRLLIGLDGTYQKWKGLEYPDLLDGLTADSRYNDVIRINTGMEYVIDPVSQNFFQRIRFRGGLSYSNAYNNFSVVNPESGLSVGMGSYREYGVNVGLGLPFRDYMTGQYVSMLNIGFGYSRQQPDANYMIKQDMFKISLNMNINEFWFFKRQFN
ncbi:MAG: hypothetical protein GX976_05660 [Bacteroidales bacterium]|nr:hypothetical protein [Bacteroidales bacterium]